MQDLIERLDRLLSVRCRMPPLGRFVFGEHTARQTFQKIRSSTLSSVTSSGFQRQASATETDSGAQMPVTSHQNPPHLALVKGYPWLSGTRRIPQEINGHPWDFGRLGPGRIGDGGGRGWMGTVINHGGMEDTRTHTQSACSLSQSHQG